MKAKIISIAFILVFLVGVLPAVAFAAGPVEYTIDVRNRTGASVELNYRGADGVNHWTTIPVGVSTLTLDEGVYDYWADPICGHIAGTMNFSQQRAILWITCDGAQTSVAVKNNRINKMICYQIYDWANQNVEGNDWVSYGEYCTKITPENLSFFDWDNWWAYLFYANGVAEWNPPGWTDYGPAYYYSALAQQPQYP